MLKVNSITVSAFRATTELLQQANRYSTMNKDEVKKIWRHADAVCFDVDSTVVQEEGIDELAKFCGKGEQVSQLTKKAMGGNSDFREALTTRLNIILPTLEQLEEFIELHPATLTPGIRELVDLLHKRGTPVYLISGGFRRFIAPIAERLRIPIENVFANRLYFENGKYVGFDFNEPTSRSGGKGEAVSLLKKKFGYKNLVLIGDGATDLEACPPADAFIGFGGNVIRESVREKSKWYVTNFEELIDQLQITNGVQ